MNKINLKIEELTQRVKLQKFSVNTIWFVVLLVLFVKSEGVIFSLYTANTSIFLLGCIALAPILFLISFSFILPPKGSLVYLFCLDTFVSLLFLADILYARAFGHLISIYMIFTTDVIGGLGVSAVSLFHWTDILLLIDLPFLFLITYKSKKRERIPKRIFLFFFSLLLSVAAISFEFQAIEHNNLVGDDNLRPLIMSPLGTHMYNLYRFANDKNYKLSSRETIDISRWISSNEQYLTSDKQYAYLKGIIKRKNIITIQCESLENFALNYAYNDQEITPNMNRLLKNSIYFTNVVEQVNEGNSSDAELMYNTSVYPINDGSAFLRFGKNGYNSLPKILNEQGYTSVAIHGDDKEFWNRDKVFPILGFDSYIDEFQFKDQRMDGMGIIDESLFMQISLEIDHLQQPFNIFAITLTSHMPFKVENLNSMLHLSKNDVSSRYLQSIHYMDMAFGTLYNHLEVSAILKNSVIIIYGDHQGVHKYYDTKLPNNDYRVPFIICIPGLDGFEVSKVGGQIDMLPTILYLLGVDEEKYADTVMGRNLLGAYSGSGILASGDVLKGVDDADHLSQAYAIADKYIRGNYYEIKVND